MRSKEFWDGVKAELPILVGVVPFGMIYGVLALQSGMNKIQAQAMSSIVFAGSAQIILTQLVHVGAPAMMMILTVAVVNLRHALYSASLAPYVRHLSTPWKLLLSYLLTDEAYAVTVVHYDATGSVPAGSGPDFRHWFFLGAGLALWGAWQLSTAAGIYLGAVVPAAWSLDFTLALTFIALVVLNLKDRPGLAAALSAGVVAVLAYGLPYKLGLMLAAGVGIAAGLLVERLGERQ